MNILLIILLIALLLVIRLGFADSEARRRADYDVRELAGELTPEEVRAEAMEERANYERRTNERKDLIW